MLGRGLLLGNISVPAMARELGRGREVNPDSGNRVGRSKMPVLYHLGCFDEFDAEGDKERHAVMEEMLRHGYRWDGPPYIRWDMERNKCKAWDLYMPKAVATTSTLNPALASRGFRVSAVRYDSPEGWNILLNNRYPPQVEELNRRLDEWGDAVNETFDLRAIEELEKSPEHAKRVEAITGGLGLNRQNEHALTCATISYLAGINISEELRHGIETLALGTEEYEDEVEELNKALLELAGQQAPIVAANSITIKQSEVKRFINSVRETQHLKPLGDRRFAEIRRAAGIKDAWLRNYSGRIYWIVPLRHLEHIKGLANMANMANIPEKPVQQSLHVGHVDQVGQGDTPSEETFGARVAKAVEMAKEGRDKEEIRKTVGSAVLEHCFEKGLIPRLGGR